MQSTLENDASGDGTRPANGSALVAMGDLIEMKRALADSMGTIAKHWEKMAGDRHYSDPQRAAWGRVFEEIVGPGPLHVLDVGCGPGLFAQIWAEMGHHVVGLDHAEEMVLTARERHGRFDRKTAFILGDAEEPDLGDELVDVVSNRAVIHMLLRPGLAVREWYRLLRPGGKLISVNFHAEKSPWWRTPWASAKQRLSYMRLQKKRNAEDEGTLAAARGSMPFKRTVPAQVAELFVAAGFERVHFVSDAEVCKAEAAHSSKLVRESAATTGRYILVASKPRP